MHDVVLAPEMPVLLFGTALIVFMFTFMLRPSRVRVELEAGGLRMGPRVVPWSGVRRMGYARRGRQAGFRVFTDGGVVIFTSEQAGTSEPEALKGEIIRRAELSAADPIRRPRGFPKHPSDVYEEWAPLRAEVAAVEAPPPERRAGRAKAALGVLAAAGIAVVKFGKYVLIALKWGAKLLKLGKIVPTAVTMLASIWAYATMWGWAFAAGFVVLIFLHEMGHVIVIKAKGLRTSPVVFIPFVGAFINIKDQMMDATVESETAYGGPAGGALAATACFIIFLATGHKFWLHLSYFGFFMNLFNMLPVAPLDGGRIVTAISTRLWLLGLLVAGALAFMTLNVILILVVLLGFMRMIGDWQARKAGKLTRYYAVPGWYRGLMSAAYFGLCAYLGYMGFHALAVDRLSMTP